MPRPHCITAGHDRLVLPRCGRKPRDHVQCALCTDHRSAATNDRATCWPAYTQQSQRRSERERCCCCLHAVDGSRCGRSDRTIARGDNSGGQQPEPPLSEPAAGRPDVSQRRADPRESGAPETNAPYCAGMWAFGGAR